MKAQNELPSLQVEAHNKHIIQKPKSQTQLEPSLPKFNFQQINV